MKTCYLLPYDLRRICAIFPLRSSVGTGTKKDDKIWYEIRLMIALEFFLDKDSWNLRNWAQGRNKTFSEVD